MPESNVVIDLSHHNQNLDFGSIAAGGILGVIHKATQGTMVRAFCVPVFYTWECCWENVERRRCARISASRSLLPVILEV